MTWTDHEFDEYGKRVLSPLRPAPSLDPQVAAEAKEQFLMHGESLGHGLISQPGGLDLEQRLRKPNVFLGTQRNTLMKALAGVLLAILIILAVSSITVYAAQSSLPGEPLYTIKSWGEDLRLSMTFSTKAKLNLTLDYTIRRVNEISDILAGGKTLNDQSSDRFKRELDYALLLAAQLDNTQIQNALGQINS
jgi:hypothetical protein